MPLRRHRLDYVFIPFFVVGILNAALMSLPESLGVPVTADSPWPPLRSLHSWAVAQEPQHLHIPPTLEASILYDGFVQLPLLVLLLIGLLRLTRWSWLPLVGVAYAVSAVLNMFFSLMQTFLGPDVPPHLAVYLPLNLPWLVLSALLLWRMWPPAHARAVEVSAEPAPPRKPLPG